MTIHELRAKRATVYDRFKALAEKADFTKDDEPVFDGLKGELDQIDATIGRLQAAQDHEAKAATPVAGQSGRRASAVVKDNPWENDADAERRGLVTAKGLVLGGVAKMIASVGGIAPLATAEAVKLYGENHPVTKALIAGNGSAGGFLVPPEYVNEIIELLRPMAVVRSSNPRVLPMPRGTLTLPAQTSAATASYGSEHGPIQASQPGVGQIVATYKKLRVLVPVSNDLMRYADPAADAFVRDDLTKVTALREDSAFLTGDGSNDSPRGFTSFANQWALANGGTAGVWLSTSNSTAAVGGNFITSNANYALSTVASELGGCVNKLDTANVPDGRRKWFMHPRSWNYLNNVQNSLGLYVYREELANGTLLGYPVGKSTQIPINLWDATGANKDCSFVMLVEMTEAMLLDSMSLEIAVSREGSYIDSRGAQQSAFSNDETIIRGIMEHDFQMRHPAAIAVAQFVCWAPAIS